LEIVLKAVMGIRKGKRRSLLLLTEEEAHRLTTALTPTHLPRSFLIQEAIQAGLRTIDPTNIPGRRSKVLCFRLPTELRDRVRALAEELDTSQQTLLRHFLFTYLSELEWKNMPPTKHRGKGRRGDGS
jgi:predicted DNA-binding protein